MFILFAVECNFITELVTYYLSSSNTSTSKGDTFDVHNHERILLN